MRRIICFVVVGLVLFSACYRPKVHVRLTNQIDTVSYYLGLFYARNLKNNPEFTKVNPEAIAMAFDQIFAKDSVKITDAEIQMKLNSYFRALQKKRGEKALKEGLEFLEKNKTKTGVITSPSGLQHEVIKSGNGPKPDSSDMVSVQYTGTFIDGKKFDSSADHGGPTKFPVIGVIKGFSEALLQMKVGSKWKLYIPSELAYGEKGTRGID